MDLTRRQFVSGIAASCLCCGCGHEEKSPDGGPPPGGTPPSPPSGGAAAGELVDMPPACRAPGGFQQVKLADERTVLVWRDQAGLHGLEGRCTHRKGVLLYDADRNDIRCPEHGSRFYVDGAVEKGPAKIALRRYDVSEESGKLRIAESH